MQINLAEKKDSLEIAQIHKKEINKGFLSFLGIPFLRRFYEAVICYKNSFCFVAKEDDKIIGFVAGSTDLKDFNSYFFRKYLLVITLIMISKIFNSFARKKIRENFLHINRDDNLPAAELLSIAIKKDFRRSGLGSSLLQKFSSEMKNRGIKTFKVLVGRELNLSGFYTKNGFQLVQGKNEPDSPSLIFIYTIN